MTTSDPIVLPGVDLAFGWATAPERWELTADGRVTIVAGPKTNLFADPGAPDDRRCSTRPGCSPPRGGMATSC